MFSEFGPVFDLVLEIVSILCQVVIERLVHKTVCALRRATRIRPAIPQFQMLESNGNRSYHHSGFNIGSIDEMVLKILKRSLNRRRSFYLNLSFLLHVRKRIFFFFF